MPPEMVADLLQRLACSERWRGIASLMAWHFVRQKGLRLVERAVTEGQTILRFSAVGLGRAIELPECKASSDDMQLFRELIGELGDDFSL
jgi:hypothetical protein